MKISVHLYSNLLLVLLLVSDFSNGANTPALSPQNGGSRGGAPAPTPHTGAPAPAPTPNTGAPASDNGGGEDNPPSPTPRAKAGYPPFNKGLNGGQKAGIAIGVIAGAALVVFGGLVFKKRSHNIRRSRYGDAARGGVL